jgi:nucleoside-diphosphate-sugar epimerase
MRVFVTGASGWIGSAVVDELLANDHEVIGLARSDASAIALEAKGAGVLRGDLDDLDSLRTGAKDADAVIHLANKHDFDNPAVSNAAERGAVQTISDALAGSDRPFVFASGAVGQMETDVSPHHGPDSMRGGSENLGLEYADRGVRAVSARFAPTVHGAGDHGFVASLVTIAREHGVAAYVGDGANRWPAVHRSDAARLVRLGLEQAKPGTILHAVAEDGVATRSIAEAIGQGLGLPVESIAPDDAVAHFGWLGRFFAMDAPMSSTATQAAFHWSPSGPTLLEDLAGGAYWPV